MRTPLIIPSETQTREFDAKLLLACEAAERGFPSVVGSRVAIHLSIDRLPRGIYLAKDVRVSSQVIFDILRRLGHRVVAWDEEALLFYRAEEYYRARVDDACLHQVERIFAWGPLNRDAVAAYPNFHGCPIEMTGNPRGDLLRRELRDFYAPDVAALRERYGDFLLVNTNFGKLNHYLPDLRVVPGEEGQHPPAHAPMNAFMTGAWQHRAEIFKYFREMVPALARRFPQNKLIIRPHPSESHETWWEAGRGFDNVEVVHEGPVQPWLMATRAMLHNGCSTGLESYLLDAPVVAYRPVVSDTYDYALSNRLSIEARSLDALCDTLRGLLDGEAPPTPTAEQEAEVDGLLAARRGPLACARILDVIERLEAEPGAPTPSSVTRLGGTLRARIRAGLKKRRSKIEGHKNSAAYTAHRFAGITRPEVEERVARFAALTGRFEGVRVRELSENVFELRPAG